MRIKTKNQVVAEVGRTTQFGINASATLLHNLSSSVYTDKILAPVREYITNALDIHVECSTSRPVEIKRPTIKDLVFEVRDYGTGLTPEEIDQFFIVYGASTKQQSEELIGGFGIGCKSAFAYSNNFIVESFVDGTATTYSFFKDDNHIPNKTVIAELPTDEPNGLKVSVPVKSNDIDSFDNAMQKVLGYHEPNTFKITPERPEPIKYRLDDLILETDEYYILENNCWNNYYMHLVVGGIPYKVPLSDIDRYSSMPNPYKVFVDKFSVVFKFTASGIPVTLSREDIQLEERTLKILGSRFDTFVNSIPDLVDRIVDIQCPSNSNKDVIKRHSIRHHFTKTSATRSTDSLQALRDSTKDFDRAFFKSFRKFAESFKGDLHPKYFVNNTIVHKTDADSIDGLTNFWRVLLSAYQGVRKHVSQTGDGELPLQLIVTNNSAKPTKGELSRHTLTVHIASVKKEDFASIEKKCKKLMKELDIDFDCVYVERENTRTKYKTTVSSFRRDFRIHRYNATKLFGWRKYDEYNIDDLASSICADMPSDEKAVYLIQTEPKENLENSLRNSLNYFTLRKKFIKKENIFFYAFADNNINKKRVKVLVDKLTEQGKKVKLITFKELYIPKEEQIKDFVAANLKSRMKDWVNLEKVDNADFHTLCDKLNIKPSATAKATAPSMSHYVRPYDNFHEIAVKELKEAEEKLIKKLSCIKAEVLVKFFETFYIEHVFGVKLDEPKQPNIDELLEEI